MAIMWLLQALYTTLLTSDLSPGGQPRGDNVTLLANTTHGTVKGQLDMTSRVPVAKFLGITYAKPPLGNLRFKAPLPADNWSGIRDATKYGDICVQSAPGIYQYLMSEDCLSVNVFTPIIRSSPFTLPMNVLVWIHGGGFSQGTGYSYGKMASLLTQKGVIVVTINYRLDVLGFLSTEDHVLPGNYGMMDQVLALKWVKANIANFGGNPNMVTIFGESAGAGSVSLLTVSPLAKGLFQRAIMQSGSSLASWAVQRPGNKISAKDYTLIVASKVGCSGQLSTSQLMSCLQKVDAHTLVNVSMTALTASGTNTAYGPRVETTLGFLPDFPERLLALGQFEHVDTMHGFCSDEFGLFLVLMDMLKTDNSTQLVDNILHYWIKLLPDDAQREMFNILQTDYIKNQASVTEQRQQALDSQDDLAFIGPTISELNTLTKMSPVKRHFLFEFNYRPSFSPGPEWTSAVHGDDIRLMMGLTDVWNYTAADVKVSDKLLEMWSNFAKTGNPTFTVPTGGTTWSPYTATQHDYLLIGQKSQTRRWSNQRPANVFEKFIRVLNGQPAPVVG